MALIHQPCSDCNSSDGLTINDDGSTKCYACGKYILPITKQINTSNFLTGYVKNIPVRGLKAETCEKYSYRVNTIDGKECHIATYRNLSGEPIFQKIRYVATKEFRTIGKVEPLLYGCHLFNNTHKKLIITEGEIDALSVNQVIGGYPVVSLPSGAKSAEKTIKHNLEWLSKFDEIVLMFDQDEPGLEAMEKAAILLPVGKVKIASTLPYKDANEMLVAGKEKELLNATWRGKEWRPDGIVSGVDLWEDVNKQIVRGLTYPYKSLTDMTYGIRTPELIVFAAGTGVGKTTIFKEIEYHLLMNENQNIGVIHLEETRQHTILSFMSRYLNKLLHKPDVIVTEEEKQEAFKATIGTNKVFIYDSFGTMDAAKIETIIRVMVKSYGCKYVFLDHIKALIDGSDENKQNELGAKIISSFAKLINELNFTLFVIQHLRKSESKKNTHEEGGRVTLDDMYGSSAIKQWAYFVFGLERNQQAKTQIERNITTIRCLKDRYTGEAVGQTIELLYNTETGKLSEIDPEDKVEDTNHVGF